MDAKLKKLVNAINNNDMRFTEKHKIGAALGGSIKGFTPEKLERAMKEANWQKQGDEFWGVIQPTRKEKNPVKEYFIEDAELEFGVSVDENGELFASTY